MEDCRSGGERLGGFNWKVVRVGGRKWGVLEFRGMPLRDFGLSG